MGTTYVLQSDRLAQLLKEWDSQLEVELALRGEVVTVGDQGPYALAMAHFMDVMDDLSEGSTFTLDALDDDLRDGLLAVLEELIQRQLDYATLKLLDAAGRYAAIQRNLHHVSHYRSTQPATQRPDLRTHLRPRRR